MKLIPRVLSWFRRHGLEVALVADPRLDEYFVGHAVVVVNGRINARRFLLRDPGGVQ